MNTRAACLVVALGLLAGCGSLPDAPRASSSSTLSATGVGPVAFGVTLAENELLLGEKASGQDAEAACRYVEFGSLPGLRFTVRDGVVTRADAASGVTNVLGVQVGDTTDAAVALYPDLRVQRNRESVGGTNLVYVARGGGHAIVLQAAGNKIIAIRAGLRSAVEGNAGCP
jgi:hypothetical protein